MRKVIGILFFWIQIVFIVVICVLGVLYSEQNHISITAGMVFALISAFLWCAWSLAYKGAIMANGFDSKIGFVPAAWGLVTIVVGLIVFNPSPAFSNTFIDIIIPASLLLFYVIDLVDYGIVVISK